MPKGLWDTIDRFSENRGGRSKWLSELAKEELLRAGIIRDHEEPQLTNTFFEVVEEVGSERVEKALIKLRKQKKELSA